MGRALKGHHWLTAVGPLHGRRGKAADRCARCGAFRLVSGGTPQFYKPESKKQRGNVTLGNGVAFVGTTAPLCEATS